MRYEHNVFGEGMCVRERGEKEGWRNRERGWGEGMVRQREKEIEKERGRWNERGKRGEVKLE